MFCSPSFNKRCLIGINFVYIIAAFILIAVASHAKHANIAESLPVVGGIIACGVFLLFVAFLGLLATFKQSQALMFYFMIILGVIFILQFSISIACLGVTVEKEKTLVRNAWNILGDDAEIHTLETTLECCGIDDDDFRRDPEKWTKANDKDEYVTNDTSIKYCMDSVKGCTPPTTLETPLDYGCPTCLSALEPNIDKAFNSTGGVGLFFAFVELVAILAAFVYRRQCANLTTIA